jgi:hypothetical protein
MDASNIAPLNRRGFLKQIGSVAAASGIATGQTKAVSIIAEPDDAIAASAPARWAVGHLRESLAARGVTVNLRQRLKDAAPGEICVLAAGSRSRLALGILKSAGAAIPAAPEALALVQGKADGKQVLLAAGHDARGLVYALTELSDRVQLLAEPLAALNVDKAVVEKPANPIRSITRLFASEVEDKPWYNDREMWPRYLTMLASQRFNRFHLSLGIGYDFLRQVTDAYFLFAYPFFLSVPGYNVRVKELPDAERDRNLQMLKFISEETVARGMQFQLGIWTHGFEWINSPNPNYTIVGLTAADQAAYSRDALTLLLKQCPAISGITFRIHGESGVAEGNYPFWKTVFDGVVRSGRKVEIDMHAKGMDQGMIDTALATGMPIRISPKYWAEHMGMPYHQAAIRELEMPHRERGDSALMALSTGSRSFLRYGYGDLMREDRRYGVLHRIWPGTQRLLLWGDPVSAAAYSRAFTFCGGDGVELFEPLGFKGRRGSGIAGSRDAYADKALQSRWDWEKYQYSFRVWGRLLYNPDTEAEVWRRDLRKPFQAGAAAVESALANASRILPVITTTHGASAGNNTYWPEVYTNQPIVDPARRHPYSDSPAPKVFGNVSPLDPQLFSRINDFAGELVKGERTGKYSPVDVAQWLEDLADAAAKHLAQADAQASGKSSPEYRRMAIDVSIQCGLGRFFAAKFRSGVLYGIYEASGDRVALAESLKAYQRARNIWAQLAEDGKVYVRDITAGELPHLRGHWLDRLPAMDADIADMSKKLETVEPGERQQRVERAVAEVLGRPKPLSVPVRHTPPTRFSPGRPLEILLSLEGDSKISSAQLYYRRVNQSERYQSTDMEARGKDYRATIPASYTESPYPLEYYFQLRESAEKACLYPGFAADLANQPYFVVRRA